MRRYVRSCLHASAYQHANITWQPNRLLFAKMKKENKEMEVLDLHALLSQWIVTLACQLLEMFIRSTRSSHDVNFTATTISDHNGLRTYGSLCVREWRFHYVSTFFDKADSLSWEVRQLFPELSKKHLKRANKCESKTKSVKIERDSRDREDCDIDRNRVERQKTERRNRNGTATGGIERHKKRVNS